MQRVYGVISLPVQQRLYTKEHITNDRRKSSGCLPERRGEGRYARVLVAISCSPCWGGDGEGGCYEVVRVDRVKRGVGVHPKPEQGGLKIPLPLNASERVGISSLRVLSSLWCLLLL